VQRSHMYKGCLSHVERLELHFRLGWAVHGISIGLPPPVPPMVPSYD
jgi:hypothetical protein